MDSLASSVRRQLTNALATATAAIWKAPAHERRAMAATLRDASEKMRAISARIEEQSP